MSKWAEQTIVKSGGGMISAGVPIGIPPSLQDPRTMLQNERKALDRQLAYFNQSDSTIILDLLSQVLDQALLRPKALAYYPIYKWNARSASPKEKMTEVYKVLQASSPVFPIHPQPVQFGEKEVEESVEGLSPSH